MGAGLSQGLEQPLAPALVTLQLQGVLWELALVLTCLGLRDS